MTKPVLFGSSYSVYVRIARLALFEKGVEYDQIEIDIFAEGGPPPDYLARQPFARIPAFQHGDVAIYETGAITRYIDEAFSGPPLMPATPAVRARVNQVTSILDNYLYRPLVWEIYVARDTAAKAGKPANEAAIAAAVDKARHCLGVLEGLAGGHPTSNDLAGNDLARDFLVGDVMTLADLQAAPMIAYGVKTSEGQQLLAEFPRLSAWWNAMSARPSILATAYPAD